MIRRAVAPHLRKLLREFPAVGLIGPRQVGKTTLARTLSTRYYDLEHEPDRLRLDLEWSELTRSRALVVLDEAQVTPDLFPRLRHTIDERRTQNGRFLLLGSVSPGLMKQVSESLAGRLALCELTPFLYSECPRVPLERQWLTGGFPDGFRTGRGRFPTWQSNYLDLMAQRDLPEWGLPAKPTTIRRFMAMTAAVHGGLWNASEIGRSMGLSYHTVNDYLGFLEGAFLIRTLPPYFANIGKRLVRSHKLYWRDSGLLHSLLGISEKGGLLSHPRVGAGWEGFVIEQILGTLRSAGKDVRPYFFRTSDGREIDLLLDTGRDRWAFEIKLTSSPRRSEIAHLEKIGGMVQATKLVLVSRTEEILTHGRLLSAPLPEVLKVLG